ncbi:protein phsophatase-2A [Tritrichomonas foetus]|uniref:Serine/threonine-protein phosphatase n=1 Tax=Tritrichomonas foetus TaxID=1144522 RepID=A0A1J4KAS0_9EUKA|nr:protein phsophatase-2A [Tritrichomonas foetus]|eukprot:OHT08527.1 protein phsophatase-2A [Tritrichomonas foetus]
MSQSDTYENIRELYDIFMTTASQTVDSYISYAELLKLPHISLHFLIHLLKTFREVVSNDPIVLDLVPNTDIQSQSADTNFICNDDETEYGYASSILIDDKIYDSPLNQFSTNYYNNDQMQNEFRDPSNSYTASSSKVNDKKSNKENIIPINGEIIIVGDLHGHILDLLRIINKFPQLPEINYLFLGDIVDRGQFSLETFILIMLMKILFPTNVFLIRGNHEFSEIFENCGFKQEIEGVYFNKFGKANHNNISNVNNNNNPNINYPPSNSNTKHINSMKNYEYGVNRGKNHIFEYLEEAFYYLPIAATISKSVVCVHGGIGPNLTIFNSLRKEVRPFNDFLNKSINDALWSDPDESIRYFEKSSRGSGHKFGMDALEQFLLNSNLKTLVRGHQCVSEGVKFQFDNKMVTVFSASNYCGVSGNKSGVLKVIGEDTFESVRFDPIPPFNRDCAIFEKFVSSLDKELKNESNNKINKIKSSKIDQTSISSKISKRNFSTRKIDNNAKLPHLGINSRMQTLPRDFMNHRNATFSKTGRDLSSTIQGSVQGHSTLHSVSLLSRKSNIPRRRASHFSIGSLY